MNDFMLTIAGQRFQAHIVSIAQSLRIIAECLVKEQKAREEESKDKSEG